VDNFELADLIDKGADYIEEHGHCKRQLRLRFDLTRPSPVCALGALRSVLNNWSSNNWELEPLLKAARAIGDTVDIPSNSSGAALSMWNDRAETTKEDVVNAFRKTAIRLREQVVPHV